jgi:hypothetical protein
VCGVASAMLLDVRIVTRWVHELAIRQAASASAAAVGARLPQPTAAAENGQQAWCEQAGGACECWKSVGMWRDRCFRHGGERAAK